jgi:hypothetical protein
MGTVLLRAPDGNDDHIAPLQIIPDIRPGHLLQDKRFSFLSGKRENRQEKHCTHNKRKLKLHKVFFLEHLTTSLYCLKKTGHELNEMESRSGYLDSFMS